MKNTKKDNHLNQIKTELNEIKKLSDSNVVLSPMTWSQGCMTFTSYVCC